MHERKTKNKDEPESSDSEPAPKRIRVDKVEIVEEIVELVKLHQKQLEPSENVDVAGQGSSENIRRENRGSVYDSLDDVGQSSPEDVSRDEGFGAVGGQGYQDSAEKYSQETAGPPGHLDVSKVHSSVSDSAVLASADGESLEEPPTNRVPEPASDASNASSSEDTDEGPGLLTLSDDVLLNILSLVCPSDLLSLAACCERLRNVAKDRTLWRICDLRPRILSLSRLHSVLFWLQPSTSVFASCGPVEIMPPPKEGETVEPTWLLSFMILICKYAPNLKTLIIENHIIDCNKILIEDFPPSIENLSLRNCVLKNVPKQASYFLGIHANLPRLKALDLTDSSWFVPHSLLALSKCPALEELVLDGCDVSECMPYASLAANYGFHHLRLLDLRNTAVSDVEVSCFNKMSTLRHLYISATDEVVPIRFSFSYVTDLSITSFGDSPSAPRQILGRRGFPPIPVEPRPPCLLETLLLNNYPGITDITLQHAAVAMPHLRVLDVVHTNVTPQGLAKFKAQRPLVTLISSKKPLSRPESPVS